ncbi:MAG: hypothetical protein QM778_37010 [Myxococcales bacterium]
MILVSVRREEEVSLAACFIDAVAPQACFVLFADELLAKRHAGKFPIAGHDAALCALNPNNFALLVVFSGARRPENLDNLELLELFREIGLSTLEIQHRFLQFDEPHAFAIGHGARQLLRWEGDDGIGYLKSACRPAQTPGRTGFVLVTSSDRVPERDRHQFAIAVLKLAAHQPDLHFVFRPHPGELRRDDAESALALLEDYRLRNVSFERELPAEALVPQCAFGVSCVSTTLLDLQRHHKPTLVYRGEHAPTLASRPAYKSFFNAFDLASSFVDMRRAPDAYLLPFEVSELKLARLQLLVRTEMAASALRPDWQGHALRAASRLEARKIAAPTLDPEVERVSKELSRLAERITVLQRSTLAYKAKKLATRLRTPKR